MECKKRSVTQQIMSNFDAPGSDSSSPVQTWCKNQFLPWWSLTATQCIKHLFTDERKGLSEIEAKNRFQHIGPNELPQDDKKSLWTLFFEQFEDLLVRILLFAALFSFVLALSDSGWRLPVSGKDLHNFVEPVVILLILIFNALVSTWQERSAEGAIEALREYQSEVAKVWRHSDEDSVGRLRTLRGSCIVPGDIVDIAVGDRVPADIRVIEILSTTLWADQSLLTGESVSVLKHASPITCSSVTSNSGDLKTDDIYYVVNQDKTNLLFSGTTVVRGRCRGVVVATGMNTEIGKIRGEIVAKPDERTPLTVKLDEFSELLSKIILIICITVWLININHFSDPVHDGSWLKGAVYYFKIAVALAVAAIPEGLPAVITTCLALGTARMARKNAIVRTLPSVETLGCTSVICSDKTGTLTTNQMLASHMMLIDDSDGQYLPDVYRLSGTTYNPFGKITSLCGVECKGVDIGPAARELVNIAVLCNDANISLVKPGSASKSHYEKVGEATEAALIVLAEKINVDGIRDSTHDSSPMVCSDHIRNKYPRVLTLEFTRERKSMSVLVKYEGNRDTLLVKGAPEAVIDRCSHIYTKNGSIVPLNEQCKQNIHKWYKDNAALRCLAFAFVDVDASKLENLDIKDFAAVESNMTFIGIVGLLDPPRPEVIDAIRLCKRAGIQVKMITGDNQNTAEHIARCIGLMESYDEASFSSYTGAQFNSLNESEQLSIMQRAKVFARVEPAHKSKIIECLQKLNEISAMTGDGVNDAPALKRAEIGIAMGSGTAVAKSASDMVLADDNFSTIVAAVSEGRAIFNNMKQFIRYLISSNIGEVVCIFLTAALGLPEALIPVQLLWVNLVTDGLPATALGFNPPDADIMEKPPRRPSEPLITKWLLVRYTIIGMYVGIATVLSSCWWYVNSDRGPHISMHILRNHFSCSQVKPSSSDFEMCKAFLVTQNQAPMTMALSVLVTIEMLNALNSLSENQSLLVMPPWVNPWLVAACALSMLQHFAIVYLSPFNAIFHTCPLNAQEWCAVLKLSFPVLLIDETLKYLSRHFLKSQLEEKKNVDIGKIEENKYSYDSFIQAGILVLVWAVYFGLLKAYPVF
ncbi:hypothetical protein GJ496_002607 [Pomphorhynchus laevis]|nr:hypothetical protein GJ496_002607 [Pomphorhynchus laevis]